MNPLFALGPVAAIPAAVVLIAAAAASGAAPTGQTRDGCGGGGTGQTVNGVRLDAEQVGNADTITTVTAARGLPAYAAVIAITTAYTESTLHNSTAQTDHDSQGLFQQRISIYTATVADDPARATGAFLDRLTAIPGWQQRPVGVDAQTVQVSAYPERYQPNAALAARLVDELWPDADAPTGSSSRASVPALCAGGGGAGTAGTLPLPGGGSVVGPTGDNVAGTTTVPAGLVLDGTDRGDAAARFALAQLGKPYIFGAAGPGAFDCSGLTLAAWASVGIALPHLAADQVAAGVSTTLGWAVTGDLVFIPGADGTPARPGHVGLVAGHRDTPQGRHLYLIQAPETGIPVEVTEVSEWTGQIVAVRRLG